MSAHRNPHAKGTKCPLDVHGAASPEVPKPRTASQTHGGAPSLIPRGMDNGSCKCNCRQLREQLPAHNPHPQVGTHVQTRHRRSWLGGAGGTGPKRRAAVRCPAHQGCAETADEAPGKDLSIQVSLAEARGVTHTHTHAHTFLFFCFRRYGWENTTIAPTPGGTRCPSRTPFPCRGDSSGRCVGQEQPVPHRRGQLGDGD